VTKLLREYGYGDRRQRPWMKRSATPLVFVGRREISASFEKRPGEVRIFEGGEFCWILKGGSRWEVH